MSALAFNRQDVADACVAYASQHEKSPEHAALHARKRDRARSLAQVGWHAYGSEWDTLQNLEDSAREHYFALVAKHEGQKAADELRGNFDRISDPRGVTIHVENSEDDPYTVVFHIHDVIADAWADAHGSLDGGTWECCDGPEFVYDMGYWHPGLWESLKEYDLDFSSWSDPDEHDEVIARHAGECDECSGDFRQAEAHLEKLGDEATETTEEREGT